MTDSTLTIDNLSDVTVTAPANAQFLKYSGGGWTNSYISYSELSGIPSTFEPSAHLHTLLGLSDTAGTAVANGFLRWNPQGTKIIYQKTIPVANITGVSKVGKTGNYADLLNKPIITDTNDYNDLLNTPNLNIYATTASLATVALSGNYADLRSKPTLFNGAYSSLTGKPTAFPPSTHTHVASDITNLNLTTSMKDLTDVGIVNVATLNEGDILYWNKALGKWKPRSNASVTKYADMDDESVPDGFLRWNSQGTKIIYQKNISVANVTGLSSVGINGYLNNLTDVVIDGTLSQGQALIYDGSKWTNDAVDVSGGSTNDSVASLTDTTISGLADGDMLVYDLVTTSWVNAPQPAVSTPSRIQNALNTSFVNVTVGNTIAVTAANGITLTSASGDIILEGQKWPNSDGTNGQVLKTDGSGNLSWFTSPAGVTTFLGLSDTPGTYTGQGNKLVSVNAGGTALEFINVPAATVTQLKNIGDVNDSALGVNANDVGKVLKWSGAEWIGQKVAYSELTNLPSNFPPAAHNHDGVYQPVDTTHRNTTRQCVLSGPNDGHINYRFLIIDGNTVKTSPSISTTPLRMCFSSGFDDGGEINHIVTCTTELVWSFAGANPGKYYLYVLRNASTGGITTAIDEAGPRVSLDKNSGGYWYPLDHRSGGAINGSFTHNWLCVGYVDIVSGYAPYVMCVRYGYSVAQKTYSCRITHSDTSCYFAGDYPIGWTIEPYGNGNQANIYHNLGSSFIYHASVTVASSNALNFTRCSQSNNHITVGQARPYINFDNPMSPTIGYEYDNGVLSILITVL